ncbi:rac gtpase-activating protein 1-like [Limosa lapponica baueri]|uniref:Rac gtpase-activating protein 1-like n=1 Tax=Limosa lapponica baueri TaxID=1758121 RepID=A0A2I0UQU2_LIMLA|nr:rac gtpase-activating protein 1-like [Limosa lapponica baueri]
MLQRRYGRLLARLERALQLLELSGSVEEDYIQIARCFEATRQRCCRLEQDRRRAREQLARVEAERAALEVKLKHARNQVEVEMNKRHRAEAELEKQERKLQLVLETLMCEPWGSGEQRSILSALVGRRFGAALAPGRRSSAVDESCQSLLSHSDISYDRTEDDVDVDVTVVRTLKRKAQERQRVSLAPQIGPVVVAKRHRSSVAPHNTVIRPEPCGVCGSRIRFGKAAVKCRQCQLLLHPKCREQCPSPCSPRPRHHAWPCEGVLADFAPPVPPLVPALVVQCVTEVETRGLTETGLYRVPGAEQLVREWKRRLLRAGGALPALGSVADIHVVCGVLKDFLRGLKEPLVTFSLHPAFLQAADIPDDAACGTALRHMVSKLPPANRDTLAFLMLHLLRVSHSPDCKMDVFNLSRVFGPTLVGHGSANPTPLVIMEDTPRQCKVVARLLSLPPDFWRGFLGTEQENLVPTPAPAGEHGEAQEPQPPPCPCPVAAEGSCVPTAGLGCDSPTETFFHPIISLEPKPGQLSPGGTCCLPNTLRSCVGMAAQPP